MQQITPLSRDHSVADTAAEDISVALLPMSVLLVDDDPVMRHIVSSWMRGRASCRVVGDAQQARDALEEQDWDVFFVDLNLGGNGPEDNGLNLVSALHQIQPKAAWVLMTALGEQREFSRAVSLGVDHILLKPFSRAAFLRTLEKIDQVRQNHEALKQARLALEQQNRKLQSLRRQEQRIAALAQKYLLFFVPDHEVKGLRISSAAQAQEGASGDLVDVVGTANGLSVVSGDVMGKGLGAAIVSAGIKTALAQVRLCDPAASPAALLQSVREKIGPMLLESESLLTLVIADINISTGMVSFVDCGAPSLLLQRGRTGHIVFASGEMMPMGIRDEPIQTTALPLMPGDRLLFLSDGVLDALGVSNSSDAYARVADQLLQCDTGVESELVHALVHQVCEAGGVADDRACVLVSCTAQAPAWRSLVHRQFPFHLNSLGDIRAWVQAHVLPWLAGHEPQAAERWMALCLLGATELASNALQHSRSGQMGGPDMSLSLILDPQGLWLEWHYRGQAFRPAPAALRRTPDPAAMAQSGYGLSIIDHVFERVHYFTGVAHSQTILAFKAAPDS